MTDKGSLNHPSQLSIVEDRSQPNVKRVLRTMYHALPSTDIVFYRKMPNNTVPPLTAPSSSPSYYHPPPLAMPFAAASSSSAHPPPRDDYEEIREQVSIMIIAYNSGTITGHK